MIAGGKICPASGVGPEVIISSPDPQLGRKAEQEQEQGQTGNC